MEYDNLHWDFREIDGYNKPFNWVISEREAGKSTGLWRKARAIYERGNTFLLIRQEKVSISETYLNDCAKVINKFINDPSDWIIFTFSKKDLEKGIVDVFAGTSKKPPRLLFRCVALSNKMSDMKSLFLENCECAFFDEFIRDTRAGEKYLPNEPFRFKELYNTFQRESKKMFKAYFFGNPYSRANPYFVEFEIDITKLKRGAIYTNASCVVQCYEIKPELKALILSKNPLYQFDNAYTKYAFDGISINDNNMILKTNQPKNFTLMIVVRLSGSLIGIYKAQYSEFDYVFWVGKVSEMSKSRTAYAFDFADLQRNTVLVDSYAKRLFFTFGEAMRNRKVAFQNAQYGTWAEEIYNYI